MKIKTKCSCVLFSAGLMVLFFSINSYAASPPNSQTGSLTVPAEPAKSVKPAKPASDRNIYIKKYNLHVINVTKSYLDRIASKRIAIPKGLTAYSAKSLKSVVHYISVNNYIAAKKAWGKVVTEVVTRKNTAPVDINAYIQYVLRESYLLQTEMLRDYADKVKYFNELKKKLRDHVARVRQKQAQARHAGIKRNILVRVVSCVPTGIVRKVQLQTTEVKLSEHQLDEYLVEMETELKSTGEDARLASIDLNNSLQRVQQTIQTLSNVSKMLHDTAMAVIRNFG